MIDVDTLTKELNTAKADVRRKAEDLRDDLRAIIRRATAALEQVDNALDDKPCALGLVEHVNADSAHKRYTELMCLIRTQNVLEYIINKNPN